MTNYLLGRITTTIITMKKYCYILTVIVALLLVANLYLWYAELSTASFLLNTLTLVLVLVVLFIAIRREK